MDISAYIKRMNQLYGSEQQVASNPLGFPEHMIHQYEGGQLTPEEFYQHQSIPQSERPLTGAEGGRVYDTRKYLQGGRVGLKPGGLVEPGVTHYAKTEEEITAEKRKKAVTEIWEKRSPRQKDLISQKTQFGERARWLETKHGQQLKWIADNGKNYENPQKMVAAFEKKFKTTLAKSELFNYPTTSKAGSRKLYLGYLQDNAFKIKGSGAENLFSFTPGFSEEELFKASILQNNSKAYNNVKRIFKMIHKDVGVLQDRASLLTVDDALKTLGKSEYQYLKNFDLIQAYAASEAGHTYGGIGKGILRETLLDKGINEQWMTSFQLIRQPLGSTDEIVKGLSAPNIRKKWNVSFEDAKKIQDGWKNVSKGRYQVGKWIDSVDKLLGKEGQFRKIFGNVHFDHILTKDFGRYKDIAKNLPRDYLIQGNYSTAAFNQWKGTNFDKPLVRKIKAWKDAAPGSEKRLRLQGEIEDLYKRFNLATDNYFGSYKPSFEGGKFKWTETTQRSPFKDVHRYVKNPKLAEQELARTALGFKNLGTQEFKGTKELIAKQNKFANLLSKNLDNLDDATQKLLGERLGCLSSGGRVMLGKGGVADCLKSKLKQNPKSFLQSVGQTAIKTKNANILNFLKTGGNIARGTGIFAMWEAAFIPLVSGLMVPQGESGKRILYEATYGPILEAIGIPAPGISEKEEQIEYFGKSGYNVSRMNEIGEEFNNLLAQESAEINRAAEIGGGTNRVSFKLQQIQDQMKKLKDEYLQVSRGFYEGPAGQYLGEEKLGQAIGDWMTGAEKLAAQKAQNLEAYKKIGGPDQANLGFFPEGLAQFRNYNTGGRVPFKFGGIDKGRRAFLQWLAGITGAGVAGATGLIKWGKVAGKGKTAVQVGDTIVQSTQGMPDWFIPLINRVVKEGDDVTKKLGTKEREIVHTKKIAEGEEVTVYQDLDTGNVRVDYDSPHNMGEGAVGPVSLEYRAPQVIDEGKMAGQKTKPEFEAYEPEPVGYTHGPDDYAIEWDGTNVVGRAEDLLSDTSKLKQFATKKKPTMKEIVESGKKKKAVQKVHENESDYIVSRQGEAEWDDYLPDIDDMDY